jgi:hypothetical protein
MGPFAVANRQEFAERVFPFLISVASTPMAFL